MPDLLGVTNPVPGHDSSNVNRNMPVSPNDPRIQNAPDLNRVGRPDNRTERQDTGDAAQGLRYDSNFASFLQRLANTPDLRESLATIFAMYEGTVVSSGIEEGLAGEMGALLNMLKMDEAELGKFLFSQLANGARFGGALFALLRNAYARASSSGVRADILQFLRCYADFGSTAHIEGNILRNLSDMADAIPASWAEKLRELMAQLENGMAAGDRKGSVELLQRGIIPYMAGYVERTHDLGLPRTLLTMLALNLARYENGSEEKLLEAFHQLSGYGTLKGQLGGIDDESLLRLLRSSQLSQNGTAVQFSDHLAAAAARGRGGGGQYKSYCVLISGGGAEDTRRRLLERGYKHPVLLLHPLQMQGQKISHGRGRSFSGPDAILLSPLLELILGPP